MRGAAPRGARDEQEAARWVRGMFARVAHRYDLANHLLSFNIDRYWRSHTVRRVRPVLERPDARVLDLCCGTGDLTLALLRSLTVAAPTGPGAVVFGSDFCHPMLISARAKIGRRRARASLFEADALRLPLRDCLARPGNRGLRFSQPGELRGRSRRNAARAAPRRHGRHPGIFTAAQRGISRAVQLLLPPHSPLDWRRAFRLPRRVHATCPNPCAGFPRPASWRKTCAAPASRRCVSSTSPAALWLLHLGDIIRRSAGLPEKPAATRLPRPLFGTPPPALPCSSRC